MSDTKKLDCRNSFCDTEWRWLDGAWVYKCIQAIFSMFGSLSVRMNIYISSQPSFYVAVIYHYFVKIVVLQPTVCRNFIKEIGIFILKSRSPSNSCVNLCFYLSTDRKYVPGKCYQILVRQQSIGNNRCRDNSQGI